MYTYYFAKRVLRGGAEGLTGYLFLSLFFFLYFIALLTLGVRFISVFIFKVYQPVTTEIGGVEC